MKRTLGLFFGCLLCCVYHAEGAEHTNVVLICVDDLRTVPGCYGGRAITPNIDRLAKSGTLFKNHYVQFPVCGPSRAALLSGQRPETTRILLNERGSRSPHSVASDPENRPTLPEHFRRHGYATACFGKVYHSRGGGDGFGWSDEPWRPADAWECYVDFTPSTPPNEQGWRPACEIFTGDARRHGDYQSTSKAVEALEKYRHRPFFIALGLYKPHLPFVAPRSCWDLYEAEQLEPIGPFDRVEGGAPWTHSKNEIETYGMRQGEFIDLGQGLSRVDVLTLTRAYYACASFADLQVGRILDAIADLGLRDNTAVVLWGDHGFHLGDYGHWCKNSQYEVNFASPLIIRVPGKPEAGIPSAALVESVDVYPTLAGVCGLPVPEHVDGVDLFSGPPKQAAYSMCIRKYHCYSVRTADYRYNEWRDQKNDYRVVHRELFHHANDDTALRNLATDPALKQVIDNHRFLLRRGLPASLPWFRPARAADETGIAAPP